MRIAARLDRHFAVAAAAASVAGAANAAIVTWNINQVVPNNFDGLYVNVQTQAFGTSAGAVPGWDINPYGASTTSISFFSAFSGGSYVQAAGGTGNLAAGTVVGASSTYGNTAASLTQGGWLLNAANYFGFRFANADGATRYGYGVMTVGATFGVRTLTTLVYEDSGASITVVPAPGAIALLGLAGFAGRRRR